MHRIFFLILEVFNVFLRVSITINLSFDNFSKVVSANNNYCLVCSNFTPGVWVNIFQKKPKPIGLCTKIVLIIGDTYVGRITSVDMRQNIIVFPKNQTLIKIELRTNIVKFLLELNVLFYSKVNLELTKQLSLLLRISLEMIAKLKLTILAIVKKTLKSFHVKRIQCKELNTSNSNYFVNYNDRVYCAMRLRIGRGAYLFARIQLRFVIRVPVGHDKRNATIQHGENRTYRYVSFCTVSHRIVSYRIVLYRYVSCRIETVSGGKSFALLGIRRPKKRQQL